MKIHSLPLVILLLQPALAAGDVSLFLGPPGGVGSIEVHDEDGILGIRRPPELQGIQLLGVDFVGRTAWSALDPAQPRYRADVAGASRLELPGGNGSLYRYQRDSSAGPSAFGFFRVDPNGGAQFLFELDGSGALGTTDPFLSKLALDVQGLSALIATTAAAGGDLLELDLASGAVTDRTSALAPQTFGSNGLLFGSASGAGATDAGILRFDRSPGAQASFVGFPAPAPAYFQGDLALSADGTCFATLAGSAASAVDVFCFGDSGDAIRLTSAPRAMTGAGYLPEVLDGPHLALSTDGSICMWSSEETRARETWSKPVVVGMSEEQITSDAHFVDTLDTSGGILPYRSNAFLMLVGEEDVLTGTIENADVYSVQVDPTTGVTTITNVSLTSGDTVQPFDAGSTIQTGDGIWSLPGTDKLLALSDSGQGGGKNDLLVVDGALGTTQTLFTSVRSVPILELVGARLALGVTRRPLTDVTEFYAGPADLSGSLSLLMSANAELELDRFAAHASGSVAFGASLAGEEYLVRADVLLGGASLFAPFPLPYGPAFGFTPSGSTALSIGIPNLVMGHGLWSSAGVIELLPAGLRTGQVLSR